MRLWFYSPGNICFKKARIWRIPVRLIKTIARAGDFLHLPLNSERLKKLTESYVVSNQKIKKALGIEKMPVSAEEGMKKTFESFQIEHRWKMNTDDTDATDDHRFLINKRTQITRMVRMNTDKNNLKISEDRFNLCHLYWACRSICVPLIRSAKVLWMDLLSL